MQRQRRSYVRAVTAGVALLAALGAWSGAVQAQTYSVYGGELTNHILIPWFEAGPISAPTINTLIGVTNANRDSSATVHVGKDLFSVGTICMHVRLWSVNAEEACEGFSQITTEDVYVDDIAGFVAENCTAPIAINRLDPDGDGFVRGYATIETMVGESEACEETLTGTQTDTGLIFGQIYHVQLAEGQTDGIAAPGFFDPVADEGLEEFPLLEAASLFVRFLTGLGDPEPDPLAVFTRLIVWSATSEACGTPIAVHDAACLLGGGIGGGGADIRLCDDEEDCVSQPKPQFEDAVNFLQVDGILPVSFDTPSGWFELVADSTFDVPLHVLAYSFQETIANSSVIFPVPRDFSPTFD